MKLYIASHSQSAAADLRAKLVAAGHEVTARWISYDKKFHLGVETYSDQERSEIAVMDEEDVRNATDGLVLIAEAEGCCVPGGKHVEAGIALGLGRPVYVVGRQENIFHAHPRAHVFPNSEELIEHLARVCSGSSRAGQ